MAVTTRQELVEYCLRRLGAPVIEINADMDQLNDRVDDALQFFREYHYDGVERMFLKQAVHGSSLTIDSDGRLDENDQVIPANTADYIIGETIVGQASGFKARVKGYVSSTVMSIDLIDDSGCAPGVSNFTTGEVIHGLHSGAQWGAASPGSIGAIERGYIDVPDSVIGVIRVFPIGATIGGNAAGNIFDVMYQFRQNDMYNLLSSDMIYYDQVKQHLDMLEQMFVGDRSLRYNRKMNRIFIDMNWRESLTDGQFLIVECYRILDPTDWPKIYDDMFLKKYLTALFKRQWGENLIKFAGIQLPGGVTLNGDIIYEKAVAEIKEIEDDVRSRFEMPAEPFMIG
jgi:hypothetical protein